MQNTITRLALLQFALIVYLTLGLGVELKTFAIDSAPPPIAVHLRDYGFLLLVIPAGWLLAASINAHRPRVNTGNGKTIIHSGIFILGGLAVLAIVATSFVAAVSAYPMRHLEETPPASERAADLKRSLL